MNFTLTHGQTFSSVNLKNPFLIARFVFFAILTYLTILLITFASWNIHAITSAGLEEVLLSSVFLLLNACIILFCLLLGVVEMLVPAMQISSVRFECIWSAAMGLLQTGNAISATISGPQGSCGVTNWASCASSSLLAPIAWLNSFTLLSYFFALTIVAVAHTNARSDVWKNSIYAMPMNRTSAGTGDCEAKYLNNRNSAAECGHAFPSMKGSEKAPWAAAAKIRRGMDHPFTINTEPTKMHNLTKASNPVAALRVHERATGNGSRFVEIINASRPPRQTDVAPGILAAHDLPIPLPCRSEWVRAGVITDGNRDCA